MFMKKIAFLLVIGLLLQPGSVKAQSREIDSLKQLLSIEQHDTTKIKLWNLLSVCYFFSRPDTALLYAQKGLILSRKVQFKKGEIESLRMSGIALFTMGKYPIALGSFQDGLKQA
jgi:hypothetical protein